MAGGDGPDALGCGTGVRVLVFQANPQTQHGKGCVRQLFLMGP